jgi:hypothetical protein|tara:strand:- start:45 stop:161 length:117 start_codon:yes stop_codon:yes gene_type:complete
MKKEKRMTIENGFGMLAMGLVAITIGAICIYLVINRKK